MWKKTWSGHRLMQKSPCFKAGISQPISWCYHPNDRSARSDLRSPRSIFLLPRQTTQVLLAGFIY